MKKSRKWFGLFVLMISVFLTACGNTANEGSNHDSGANDTNQQLGGEEETIKLRVMWWGSQTRHDATLKALDKYTELNPHVTFEPEFSGWDGYWDKLSTQAAAKNAPDIIQMDAAYLQEYATRGQLTEILDVDVSQVDQALLDSGKVDGKLYAVALGNNAYGMAYNKEAVEKLGLDIPQHGWTWEDYFQFARDAKTKLGEDQYAILDGIKALDVYGLYQMSQGKGYYVTEDGRFNIDKETWLEWAHIFEELRKEGVVPPAQISVTDKELDPTQDLLAQGKILMRPLHAAQSTALDSLNPGAMQMVTMPRGEGGAGWLKPSMFWSISSNSKYAEEAQKFISWFINDQESAEILGTSRGIPVNTSILESMASTFTAADTMGIELIQETSPIAQPFHADPKGWSNFRNKDYMMIAEQLMYFQITPEEAWEEIVNKSKEYEM